MNQIKQPPVPCDGIEITHFGPWVRYSTVVYLYSDVLDELAFNAKERPMCCMLKGEYCIVPPSMRSQGINAAMDFIEVTSFRNVYPCNDGLEYADELRRQRDFRPPTDGTTLLGISFMKPSFVKPTLEELMLMRSYFANVIQVAVYVFADGTRPVVYMLSDENDSLAEVGYEILHPSDVMPSFHEPH